MTDVTHPLLTLASVPKSLGVNLNLASYMYGFTALITYMYVQPQIHTLDT